MLWIAESACDQFTKVSLGKGRVIEEKLFLLNSKTKLNIFISTFITIFAYDNFLVI